MGFASGAVSYQRFFIEGSFPGEIDDTLVDALQQRAFDRTAPQPDDTQIGWIGPRHLFDTELHADALAAGRFVHLAVRLDRLKVPGNVLRSYIRLEEQQVREAQGRPMLTKGEKRRAREAAIIRADEEMRAGSFRRITSYPVLIDLERRELFLGSTGQGLADKVMELFRMTFAAALNPATPAGIAERMLSDEFEKLERVEPLRLVAPPTEDATLDGDPGDLSFLGREFLSWLWYRIDGAQTLQLSDGGELTIAIDKTLRLKCDYGLTGTDAISADVPTQLPEARAALRSGKQPIKAGLVIGAPLGEFSCALDGQRFTLSGLNVPEDRSVQDAAARREARFEAISDVAALLDAAFEVFLLRRLRSDWDNEARAMAAWAAGTPATMFSVA